MMNVKRIIHIFIYNSAVNVYIYISIIQHHYETVLCPSIQYPFLNYVKLRGHNTGQDMYLHDLLVKRVHSTTQQ